MQKNRNHLILFTNNPLSCLLNVQYTPTCVITQFVIFPATINTTIPFQTKILVLVDQKKGGKILDSDQVVSTV